MSVINLGNQYITFDYKHPAKGKDFNTLLREAIKPGVYKGGIITPTGGAEISIAPFVVYINVGDDKLCRVETRAAVNISVTEATPVIALTYTWANVSENWLDFNQRASGSAPLTNEIVLGECEFAGGVITGINYDDKTWGIQYDGTVNPDFNADQVDGCDVETTLSPTLNTRIPTSKAVYDKTYQFKIGSNYHNRKDFNKVKSDSARTTLVIPNYIETVIDGDVFQNLTSFEIDINTSTYWDDITVIDWTTPANRAGKDFYIYACIPTSGETFDIKLSANATFPTGYTASNSRKIGGFHCLCVSAGTAVYEYINEGKDADYLENMFADGSTIANGGTRHWLKNFIQGDILPLSCWDLIHRPNENADVEGKVYDPKTNLWVDIYLPSWNAGLSKLWSVYGGTIADGASSPAFHWYRFSQVFTNQGQRLPRQDHFVSCSLGSPQGVQISTGVDPVTTGGKTASNNLRIISNIGIEDATGIIWQWGSEGGTNTTTSYSDAYDANDKNVGGQECSKVTRPVFGGLWGNGVGCGSRGSSWPFVGLNLSSAISGRGFAEPK